MSVIEKWALQALVVILVAWAASVAAQWSANVVNSTSSDRLAALSNVRLSGESLTATASKKAQGDAASVGALSESNE